MNLESLPKFYSPKSPKLRDETPATKTDALSITDVMAAQGMVQSTPPPLGFSLFLAKVGISDPQTAIEGLMHYAQSLKNPVLMKLSDKARNEILPVLVQFAYADYSRSAASKSTCLHCDGKGVISTACRGCKGKGTVIDEKRTKLIGVPVMKVCGRCNGNRFSRVPTSLARVIVEKIVPDLTQYQWYSGYAEVIDKLVTKCWQEEAYAEAQLRKVTR